MKWTGSPLTILSDTSDFRCDFYLFIYLFIYWGREGEWKLKGLSEFFGKNDRNFGWYFVNKDSFF